LTWLALLGLLPVFGCGDDEAPPLSSPVGPVVPETQRPGDPAAGYRALINRGYVSCGMPYSAWVKVVPPRPSGIPGREGDNANLPPQLTAFRTASGVEVVGPNCLACHSGHINGQYVIGLGNTDQDLTGDLSAYVLFAGGLVTDPVEQTEYQKFKQRVDAIAPYVGTRTIGSNSADNLGVVLFAHRDVATLAWSQKPLLALPPQEPVPVRVPPWWRMSKKNAMFYNAAGRGDQARIMMTASALCTDSVPAAEAIDGYFPDVRAWIVELLPPSWPFAIDRARAAQGRAVFEDTCARCHGTYGAGGSYPNLVVTVEEVGTDPMLAVDAAGFAGRFVNWFNRSFYGRIARYAPARGYIAPPLDGIWAVAPYLHNGSVPTLAALLSSSTRPRYWTRSFDSTDYDPAGVGWHFSALDHGQAEASSEDLRKRIYDTTLPGYSNAGHPFGDGLTTDQRAAVIEYLKTL